MDHAVTTNRDARWAFRADATQEPARRFSRPVRAHLVGARGAGMSAIASVLAARGWRLTASDAQLTVGRLLPGTRVRVAPRHSPRYLPSGTDLVVHSSAVADDNCERRRAMRLGIPVLSYPQALGELMQGSHGVAVAGTHGKTTTTALVAHILIQAGLDPTVILGGTPIGWQTGGRAGDGAHTLVEACEYRGNFLHINPRLAAILNVEPDHFDYFESAQHLTETFSQFARRIPSEGSLLAYSGCATTREIARQANCRILTFGRDASDHWRMENVVESAGRYSFEVWRGAARFAEIQSPLAGEHNVLNALAAIALASELGLESEAIVQAVRDFRGVGRRLEVVGTWREITIIDDYAHHPSAIRASLRAVRDLFPGRRVWCVFEPHQASRLRALLDDFAASLDNSERVVVTDVFPARESARDAGAARDLVALLRERGRVATLAETFDQAMKVLRDVLPGDVIVTLGAGEVGKIRHAIVERLRRDTASV